MSSDRSLTSKQLTFVQAIVDGLNQSQAYRLAYDAENMLPATIAHNASVMAGDNNIATSIQELRDQITAGQAWTFAKGMTEIETNIANARRDKQHGPARASTRDALEMSRLLDAKESSQPVPITKVTVILNHGNATESTKVVDGTVVDTVDMDEDQVQETGYE